MTRQYSRSQVGERAKGKAPRNHRVNLTIVGAIALDGVRTMMAYEGGTTRDAFLHFVEEGLAPSLNPGDTVVMDNLRAHYTDGVKQAIEAVGATVLYLPPYSPELNPIEMTWSKLKALLKKAEARTLRLLAGAISRSCEAIRLSDIFGWFRHAGYLAQPK
jgi:transposase